MAGYPAAARETEEGKRLIGAGIRLTPSAKFNVFKFFGARCLRDEYSAAVQPVLHKTADQQQR